MTRRIVFMDRDGVLTIPIAKDGKGFAPRSLDELEFYPDAVESVKALRLAGFEVVVATNQPDVSSGKISPLELERIHAEVRRKLGVNGIRTCPHQTKDGCYCRKPLPGLLLAEEALGGIDFANSWMLGDRDSDIQTGLAAGCKTVFIDRGWKNETGVMASSRAGKLSDAVAFVLEKGRLPED